MVGFLLLLFGSLGVEPLWWIGLGVTAYGLAYLFVHEVYIHRRLTRVRCLVSRYLEWLRESHRHHHAGGGEPYGMLLPLVRGGMASRVQSSDLLDRRVHTSP